MCPSAASEKNDTAAAEKAGGTEIDESMNGCNSCTACQKIKKNRCITLHVRRLCADKLLYLGMASEIIYCKLHCIVNNLRSLKSFPLARAVACHVSSSGLHVGRVQVSNLASCQIIS
jgi:hypothetical protein